MYDKYEELLKRDSITSYEVAKKTGIAQSTLSEWKNGKITPKLDKLVNLAKFFCVPVTYFLDNSNNEEKIHEEN